MTLLAKCTAVVFVLITTLGSAAANAQDYPAHPVRIIVGYPPGGPTDLIARLLAQELSKVMGQPFVVENRGGANGIIGTELVTRSKPDGYTLLFGTSSLASNGSLYSQLPYDASKDLTPITLVANTPYFLTANMSVPANSVHELIALAKSKPGEIHFASAGTGAGTHLAGELFNQKTGVKLAHVPYKGTGPAVNDMLGGHVDIMFVGLPSSIEFVKAGKLKLLAVCDAERSVLMPEIPAVAEAGVPGYESSAWFALFGPRDMPLEIRTKISKAVAQLLQTESVRSQLLTMGAVPLSNTPQEFTEYFQREVVRYAQVIKQSGARAD